MSHSGRYISVFPRQGAFTLVELLIVIGIIAILTGLLLPVIGRAREKANIVRCSSNLREIYNGTRMYAEDNRDKWPGPLANGNYKYHTGT